MTKILYVSKGKIVETLVLTLVRTDCYRVDLVGSRRGPDFDSSLVSLLSSMSTRQGRGHW